MRTSQFPVETKTIFLQKRRHVRVGPVVNSSGHAHRISAWDERQKTPNLAVNGKIRRLRRAWSKMRHLLMVFSLAILRSQIEVGAALLVAPRLLDWQTRSAALAGRAQSLENIRAICAILCATLLTMKNIDLLTVVSAG